MTLPASGPISMRDVNVELRANPESPLNMNHPDLRKIAGKAFEPSGSQISMSDLLGKSYFLYNLYSIWLPSQFLPPGSVPNLPAPAFGGADGFWVESLDASIVLSAIKAYDQSNNLIGQYNWHQSLGGFESRTTFSDGINNTGLDSKTNNINLRKRLNGSSTATIRPWRLEVVAESGEVYDLYGHRGNIPVVGTNTGIRSFGDTNLGVKRIVPPNV